MAKILVVDDRPTNRQFLLTLLGYGGHWLLEAADGAQALECVRAEHPDLVITDILMPTMDGYEFVRHLRADPDLAPTPVIFYTATYSEPQANALAETCGVRVVLPKPCDPERILSTVSRVLGETVDITLSLQMQTQIQGAAISDVGRLDEQLAGYVDGLSAVTSKLGKLAGDRGKPRVREQARQVSEELARKIDSLQRVASRLSAIIEVGMAVTAERDPARLVEVFFGAACDVIDSRYAAIGMLDDKEEALRFVFAKRIEPRILRDGGRVGLLGRLLARRLPLRLRSTEVRPEAIGLPAGHPPVSTFLGIPVASKERVYGWLYFADKDGRGDFTEEDERLAGMMGARLAVLYENAVLYDVIQRHAAQLQIEVAERRQAERALRGSEQRFRQMAENIRDVFFLVDPDQSRMHYVSPAYEEIWGRSCQSLYDDPYSWLESIHPDDRVHAKQKSSEGWTTGGFDFEYRIRRPDGSIRWIHARGFPILDEAGKIYRTAGIAEDVTARKEAQIRIQRLSRVHAVLSGINAVIVRVRDRGELFREACRIAVEAGEFPMAWVGLADGQWRRVNPVAWSGEAEAFLASAPLSMKPNGAEGRGMAAIALAEKKAMISNDIQSDPRTQLKEQCQARGVNSLVIMPLVVQDKGVGVLALYAREIGFFDDEEMKLLLELASDVSFALDHIEKAERLDYLAFYDSLTGLPNRTLFMERTEQLVQDAVRAQRRLAVALIDLDRFKTINDTLGRHFGDEIIKEAGVRLQHAGGDPGRLARVVADRFAIVMPDVSTEQEVARRLEELLRYCFGEPYRTGGTDLRISAKFGVAVFPADGSNADALFRNAEAALKKAKTSGERYVFYTQKMTERIAERLALESKLQLALERHEFVLHYQPKFGAETRRIEGVEALIRWRSPEAGLIPPMQFVPLLEETGLIFEVGNWAMRQAVCDHRRWKDLGLASPRVAVNVSAVQLRRRDFVESVRRVLDEGSGLAAMDLEITESLIMEDIHENRGKLETIRQLGVNIAIDDFGTGYSSLIYLAKLPVNMLKIDRSFVVGMLGDPIVMTLVTTIVSMSHALGLKVVAEGVDSEDQANVLRRLRCDQIQGFLYSKPLPCDALTALLVSARETDGKQ